MICNEHLCLKQVWDETSYSKTEFSTSTKNVASQ